MNHDTDHEAAPPQPAPEPTSGAAMQHRDPIQEIWDETPDDRLLSEALAPTPTDVSAAAREAAAEIVVRMFVDTRNKGSRVRAEAYAQVVIEAQRATDRQRIAELETALTKARAVAKNMQSRLDQLKGLR